MLYIQRKGSQAMPVPADSSIETTINVKNNYPDHHLGSKINLSGFIYKLVLLSKQKILSTCSNLVYCIEKSRMLLPLD